MLNLSLRKVDFNELRIEDLAKRPILDTLAKFWNKSEAEYNEFLASHGIDLFKRFSSMAELKECMDNDISILNNIAEHNVENGFDFKTINFLKSKNLKNIADHEFMKLAIDLRGIENKENKELIKDLFLETKSVSLVDFVDVDENVCSLIYHKKGAFYYHNEPFVNNAREQISLLENYGVPKDNNFIVARFLLDLATKFDDNNIQELFCVNYANDERNIKRVEEIIYWGNLSKEEKQEQKQILKNQEQIDSEAKSIAKAELKEEINEKRASLKQADAHQEIEKDKSVRLYSVVEHIPQIEIKNNEDKITDIVARSIELYRQKELEKTKSRLDTAEKDSVAAYNTLKEYLNNGLSILEAIKNIQQRYRNEDTVNFASLLFSQDILNVSYKEQKIIELTQEKEELGKELENVYAEIDKKEETISKLRSTMQTKFNELESFKYELQKEFEINLQAKEAEMAEALETLQNQQNNIVNEYEAEIVELEKNNRMLADEKEKEKEKVIELSLEKKTLEKNLNELYSNLQAKEAQFSVEVDNLNAENKTLKEENIELVTQNATLANNLKVNKIELENLSNEFKAKLEQVELETKQMYKLEAQMEMIQEKENAYKEQIQELKSKNQMLENKLNSIFDTMLDKKIDAKSQDDKPKRSTRSKDILGDI